MKEIKDLNNYLNNPEVKIISIIQEYINYLKGIDNYSFDEIAELEKTLEDINSGQLNEIGKKMALDFFITSVCTLAISGVLNLGAATVNLNVIHTDSPLIQLIAKLINMYELGTLLPFVPLSGVSGLLRVAYLATNRVFPYIQSLPQEERSSEIKKSGLLLLLASMDGGYVATPAVTLMTSHGNKKILNAMLWKTKDKLDDARINLKLTGQKAINRIDSLMLALNGLENESYKLES